MFLWKESSGEVLEEPAIATKMMIICYISMLQLVADSKKDFRSTTFLGNNKISVSAYFRYHRDFFVVRPVWRVTW